MSERFKVGDFTDGGNGIGKVGLQLATEYSYNTALDGDELTSEIDFE